MKPAANHTNKRLRLNKDLEALQGSLDSTRVELEAKAAKERAAATRQAKSFAKVISKFKFDPAGQQQDDERQLNDQRE